MADGHLCPNWGRTQLHGGDDAAVFVYLEDVAPSGYTHYVTEGCLRAGFHHSCAESEDGSSEFRRADLQPFTRGVLQVSSPAWLPVPLRSLRWSGLARMCTYPCPIERA